MTSIRRGQLITPFGVGSVVDVGAESYTCVDISHWDTNDTVGLDGSTLATRLGKEIRAPIDSVPFYRFPRWQFCPKCRRMHRINDAWEEAHQAKYPGKPHRCPDCRKVDLTPMGFVQACEDGHLDEVDWFRWAHRNRQGAATGACTPASARMSFRTTGASGGDWSTLAIECDCGARNDFDGLTTRPLFWNCSGRQPWVAVRGSCQKPAYALRRGSSNLYFPTTLSAIDVEAIDHRDAAAVRGKVVEILNSGAWAPRIMIENMVSIQGIEAVLRVFETKLVDLSRELNAEIADVKEAFASILEGEEDAPHDKGADPERAMRQVEILHGEWKVFSRTSALRSEKLIVLPQVLDAIPSGALRSLIHRISLVPRLREVRAITGFRRIGDANSPEIPVDLSGSKTWIPGVEVWGEGIFVEFNEAYVAVWERRTSRHFAARTAALHSGLAPWQDLGSASQRFVALHTLSHVIMRRLAFDAGYSSSSLRERIYAGGTDFPMAGILIYTADADSEGSLGGLVKMGEPARLARTLEAALADASWCSADPVCGETPKQGPRGMNGAACHACCLASETSCTHGNQFLDRRMMLNLRSVPMDKGLIDVPA